jgi:hypothetical protein
MVKKWKSSDMKRGMRSGGGSGSYFLGFLGALLYYIHAADTFGAGVIGILKAIVWPAFLVYHLLGL